jgi:photosystem II stability/assembly factor-like uncharacterized protein
MTSHPAAILAGAAVLFAGASTRADAPALPHATPARPQAGSPVFTALRWRSIGPFRGGRVLAVAGSSDSPLHFYFGAVNGGVWETRDAGRTWTPIFDEAPVGSVGALAVAPSQPQTLYVGTGEADMRSDIAQGVGMFKSTDGGAHWAASGLTDTQQIAKVIVDPANPDVLLVAALGHPYGPNAERGVFRSADGGKSWSKTLFKNADTGAIDLAFKPGDPSAVYAALWQTRRPPWNTYPPSSGPGSGFYKSTDGGKTWAQVKGAGLPDKPGRIGIAVSPAAPNRVYALIDAIDGGGLYRSDDSGVTWTKTTGDKRIWARGWYFGEVVVNPKNPDQLWVMDTIVLRSDDGGKSFIPEKGDPTGDDFHALWIDPNDPDRRILGVDQGTLVTLNGGRTWSSWFNQPTGQFYHVATDNRFPYRVYGAQQDSGAAGVSSRTWGWDGIDMGEFHEVTAGGESDNIAPDPDDPDTVFGGRVDKLDLRSGQTRSVDPTLALPDNYRGTWTLPLVFSKRDHALYFGNQRIFKTTDGGEHWAAISPDLTGADPGAPSTLDAPTREDAAEVGPRRGVVYSIGPSPISAADLWAGTDDGLVWRTRDGGAHWTDVTPKGLRPWSKIGAVEPSHFNADTAYVAVDRHRVDDRAPYVLATHDGGKSWTAITAGLAETGALNSINVVREDPVRPGLLYAGTESGAFVSFNDGRGWQPLRAGLPHTSVRDIEVHGDDLVIATHGRGFYILDDIEPLREIAADPHPGARLFNPAIAIRARPVPFAGTPKPKDEPMAANPPDGAYLDYALPAAASGPVEIVIHAADGSPVRTYSSADPVPPTPPLGLLPIAPEWLRPHQALSAAPGEHRFVWDLHYAALEGHGPGVWAPPGRYTVTLNADGKTFTVPLAVAPDPRVKLAPEAYQREFRLSRQIEAERTRAVTALAEAVKLRAALVKAEAGPAANKKPLTALIAELDAVAAPPSDERHPGVPEPHKPLTALSSLIGAFERLYGAVDDADADPSADALAGYAQASAALDQTLTRWADLKGRIGSALKGAG